MKKVEVAKPDMLQFIKSCKLHSKNMDDIFNKVQESEKRGKMLAAEMNRFDLDLDRFLHFGLNIKLTRLNNILNNSFNL